MTTSLLLNSTGDSTGVVLRRGLGRVRGEECEKDTQEQGLEKARHVDLSRVDVLAYTRVVGTEALRDFYDIYTDVATFLAWMIERRGTGDGSWETPKATEAIL